MADWESAPVVDSGDSGQKSAWMSAPVVNQPKATGGGALAAAAEGAANTMSFGLLDRAAGLAGAAYDWTQGRGFDYGKNLESARGELGRTAEQHPYAFIGGELAGGLAVPGAAASRAPTLAGRIGSGALAGGLQGAAFGATGAKDLTNVPDVAKRATIGGLAGAAVGAALPPIVEGAAKAGSIIKESPVGDFARGLMAPNRQVMTQIGRAAQKDIRSGTSGLGPAEFAAAQQRGQTPTVLDMGGQALRDQARTAANISPEAQGALQNVMNERFRTQQERVGGLLEGMIGKDATSTMEDLQTAARAANKPIWKEAYKEGAGGIWTPEIQRLMQAPAVGDAVKDAIKTGANWDVQHGFPPVKVPFEAAADGTVKLKTNADGSAAIPSLQFWHHVKRSLDKDITAALTGGQKDVAANLIGLKDQLNSQLVKAVPKFAYANGIAASFFRKENALDAGAEFAKAKGENAVFKRVIDKMTPPERELFKIGLGSKVASTVLESNDRRSIMNVIFKSPAERERLEMGMGEEDTKLLEAYLNVEEVFDNSRKAVMGNSTTAQQLSRMGKLGGPVSQIVGAGAGGALGGVPGAILGAIMGSVAKSVKAGVDEKVARMLGEKLASKDPAVYNLALKKVAGNPKIQRFIEGLSPQIISSALPTVMWQMKGWKIGTPPAPKPMKWPKPEATSPGPQHEDAAP